MNQLPATPPSSLPSIIERAASDPTFDIDKLQRLLDMQEQHELRTAQNAFSAAHADAEAEMETISADANNPQTRSRYATFAQLDRATRPIYTKYGFSISFTTEPMSTENSLLVVGTLSHRQGHTKRYQVPVPITTVGIQGKAMMTPIHATMSAVSYGRRNLEIMMFNLQIGDDDDGNRAGGGVGRRPPPPAGDARLNQARNKFELIDTETGEVVTRPAAIPFVNDDYRSWGEKLVGALNNLATSIGDIDEWLQLNVDVTENMSKQKPAMFDALLRAIGAAKERFLTQ